jgi:hypothetical protein
VPRGARTARGAAAVPAPGPLGLPEPPGPPGPPLTCAVVDGEVVGLMASILRPRPPFHPLDTRLPKSYNLNMFNFGRRTSGPTEGRPAAAAARPPGGARA